MGDGREWSETTLLHKGKIEKDSEEWSNGEKKLGSITKMFLKEFNVIKAKSDFCSSSQVSEYERGHL